VSSQLSAFGHAHGEALAEYPHLAALSPMVHDLDPGRVNVAGDFGLDLDYTLSERDAAQLHLGLRESARLLLAAGAEKVYVPRARTVEITRLADVDAAFAAFRIRPYDTDVTAVHPMGSVWMGDDATRACVDSTGRYHHLDNLFVADTSLYPSSIGGPPQITAYTLGTHVGRQIAAYLG
jgi:choline dehydrogenase-like flavoprotein